MDSQKRIRVIAGPNGSGKSTLLNLIRNRVPIGPYVNADNIAKLLIEQRVVNLMGTFGITATQLSFRNYMDGAGKEWVDKARKEGFGISLSFDNNNLLVNSASSLGYDAALAADFIRFELLRMETSFTFETVLSHRSKIRFLEMAKGLGYKIYLYFVSTVSPEININRVRQRVLKGGHDVDESRIRNRYDLSLTLLSDLVSIAHRSYIFDNSIENSQIKLFAEVNDQKQIAIPDEALPWWLVDHLLTPLQKKYTVLTA